jgi:hypothetical protein
MKKQKLMVKNEECFLLDKEPIGLKEAVGTLAMSIYGTLLTLKEVNDKKKKKRLIAKINYQSRCLNSLSNALLAINSAKKDYFYSPSMAKLVKTQKGSEKND